MPTSSGQGREISLLILIINTNCKLTYEEDSASLIYPRKPYENQIPYWAAFQFRRLSEFNPDQPRFVCRSTGRSTDPSPSRPCRSTVPNRELGNVSRSTGRSTVLLLRSTAAACARWYTPVDRSGRPVALLLLLILHIFFLVIVDFLSLPIILYLGEDFSNLSRIET